METQTPKLDYKWKHPQDLRALKSFGWEYPEAKKIILYRGKEKLLRDGIAIEPCEDFLLSLK